MKNKPATKTRINELYEAAASISNMTGQPIFLVLLPFSMGLAIGAMEGKQDTGELLQQLRALVEVANIERQS